jgi:uncharacterized membrane protein YraQ (UPF0718 family)
LITLAALALSYRKDPERTKKALLVSYRSFMALIPSLLGMTGIIGLLLALTPPEVLANLFKFHGLAGFALISVVGAIITMPAPVAFPLAGTMLRLGASYSALAAFVTTLTMVGTVTAPMEIQYFGKRFTLVRQTLSFALAILIGALMGVIVH